MASNGRLPRNALAQITQAANGEQAYLRTDAARAFMAMNKESEREFGVTLRARSARTAYRDIDAQRYFWAGSPTNPRRTWRGNLAAYPGQSNHGAGIAVDFSSKRQRYIVDQIGRKYGWSKAWSDAPGEWWHMKWRVGEYAAVDKATDPVIKKGSIDASSVTRIQKMLKGLNLTRIVNGRYNIWTRRAVRRFQRKHGLLVDGVVDTKTWQALRRAGKKQ